MTEIPGLKRSERLAACSNVACSAAIPTVSAPGVAVYVPDAPTKLWAQERTRTQGSARIEQEENYRSLASISILYSIYVFILFVSISTFLSRSRSISISISTPISISYAIL